ncbi:hypothetical protein N7520_005827 [Penicillium odoratum]|uniref:uncharacterized protein n=1 Tax=Penicillium odoratum TaxID=1167516 RepID=UPI0025477EC9|nr:uncharacterized protein N7520_005827 [Penicillium odoratum]KAJ5758671.1 hypothetical protein N7520_005827 [Penicillium odoratum]
MPICIECSYPVSHLYSAYSRADDRSQGKGVRLTQCPRCQRFADKYVEYDFVVIFIDLVLIKPQSPGRTRERNANESLLQRSIIRLSVLLLLFDVYLTWARLEKDPSLATTFISRTPIIIQYLFFLTLNALATLAHHLTVRLVASILVPNTRRYGASEASNSGVTSNSNIGAADTTITTPFPSGPPTPTVKPSPSSQALNTQIQANPATQPKLTPNLAPSSDTLSPQDPSLKQQGIPTSASTSSIPLPPARPAPLRRASTAPIQNIQPLPPTNSRKPHSNQHSTASKQLRKAIPHPIGNLGRRWQRKPEQNKQQQ